MQLLHSIKRKVDLFIEWFCIAILGIMTILVTYQVVTRYIFSKPSAVSEVAAQYLFVWVVMFGSAYVFGLGEHLDITVLKDKFSPLWLFVVEVVTNIVLVLFAAMVLLYGGYSVTAQQMGTADAALQIPMGVIYCAIPVCGIFILFYAVYNVALSFQNYRRGVSGTDDDSSVGTTM